MSNLRRRPSLKPIQRPAARKALERIHEELQTIISCHPDIGYDTAESRNLANRAVNEALERVGWLYADSSPSRSD